jgi:hypothetical protein
LKELRGKDSRARQRLLQEVPMCEAGMDMDSHLRLTMRRVIKQILYHMRKRK